MKPFAFNNSGYIPSNLTSGTPFLESSQPPVTFPSVYVAPIEGLPILMQAKQPSCVGHGVAWAVMQKELKEYGFFKLLSPRFLYALSKQTDGLPNQEGTSIQNVLRILKETGVCEDSFFPNDVSLPYEEYINVSKIPQEAYDNAKLHKRDSRFLLDLSFTGLRNGIYQNDIVIVGMDISDSWWTDTQGNVTWAAPKILPIRPPLPSTSRHCVCLYTYNNDIGLDGLMNWWSKDWGNQGTAFFYKNELPFIYQAAVLL